MTHAFGFTSSPLYHYSPLSIHYFIAAKCLENLFNLYALQTSIDEYESYTSINMYVQYLSKAYCEISYFISVF